jgi:hypothetical protein
LYLDILLLDKNCNITFPEQFISAPNQKNKIQYRKATYKAWVASVNTKHKLKFIVGDVFPSVKWMKKKYKCNGMKVWIYYVRRMAKLLWLIGKYESQNTNGKMQKSNHKIKK